MCFTALSRERGGRPGDNLVRQVRQVAAHQPVHLDHGRRLASLGDLVGAAQHVPGALRRGDHYHRGEQPFGPEHETGDGGPRAQPCPPRRRSPTPSAATANANAPPAAGPRSPQPNVTWCDWSAKDWPTTTSPPGFSSHRAPCNPTSPTSTPNSASPRACSSPKRQPATPDKKYVQRPLSTRAARPPRERSGSRHRVSARVFEFCSGLVDLVVCISHHGGGGHQRLRISKRRSTPSIRRRSASAPVNG
jgi:hypothetical protein